MAQKQINSEHSPSLNWIAWILFQIMVGNPSFSVIFWPLAGQTLAKVAQKLIKSEHSPNKYTHKFELDCINTFSDNGRKPPFPVILWPPEGQKFGQRGPKGNQFWTLTQCVYIPSLNWMNSKPQPILHHYRSVNSLRPSDAYMRR